MVLVDIKIEEIGGKCVVFMLEGGEEVVIGLIEKMLKFKKNIVDFIDIIDIYGVDIVWWFMLLDSLLECDVIWIEDGV